MSMMHAWVGNDVILINICETSGMKWSNCIQIVPALEELGPSITEAQRPPPKQKTNGSTIAFNKTTKLA